MAADTGVAISTYQTYFMYRTTSSGTYDKVVDIKTYPDMIGSVRLVLC